MRRFLQIFWAHIRAGWWCLLRAHKGHCLYTERSQPDGVVTKIGVCTGSLKDRSFQTVKVFYDRGGE